MKIINIMIVFLLLNCCLVFGEPVQLPNEPSPKLINKIDSEHKNTRLYLSKELTIREQNFLKEFTTRADYYENSMEELINKFILKIGFVFSGILIFILSIYNLIRNKLEKKRYAVLVESIKEDIKTDFKQNIKEYMTFPDKDINEFNKINNIKPAPVPPFNKKKTEESKPKKNIFSKFKLGVKQ